MLKTFCPKTDLTNEDHLWFLNISFAEYYLTGVKMKKNALDEARSSSWQLAKLGKVKLILYVPNVFYYSRFLFLDLDTPEHFFCYIALHWPNEVGGERETDTQYLPTYDEDIISR